MWQEMKVLELRRLPCREHTNEIEYGLNELRQTLNGSVKKKYYWGLKVGECKSCTYRSPEAMLEKLETCLLPFVPDVSRSEILRLEGFHF